MTTNDEVPAAANGEDLEQGMPTTGNGGEAEHNANGFGGQAVTAFHPVPVGNRRSWQEHVMLVSAPWRRAVQDFLETGDALEVASNELDPQDYNTMLAEVSMDSATARKLRIIAKNEVLRSHVNAIPRSYTTLYALTLIPKPRLESLIADGVVHANLKRSQAENLADESGDTVRPVRQQRQSRLVQQREMATDDEVSEGAEHGQQQSDPERIALDAEDIIEALKEVLDRNRRKIERVREAGGSVERAMLANGLWEHATIISRLAGNEDLPPGNPPDPTPRPTIDPHVATLVDAAMQVAGSDMVLSYIRGLEEANTVSLNQFKQAVRAVEQKLAAQ